MFADEQGPAALRTDMIQALAFSVGEADSEIEDDTEPCVAALAGVWNGKQGHVIVLVRSVRSTRVRRFAFTEPIEAIEELKQVVELAMDFATQMGFVMDGPGFRGLNSRERGKRFRRWNELRKSKRAPGKEKKSAAAKDTSPAETAKPVVVPGQAAPAVDKNEISGAGVLGRIALVRQEDDDRPSRLGRLLGFY